MIPHPLPSNEAQTGFERVQEALRRSEEHFRLLIEDSLEVIAVLDTDGTVRFLGPSVERVLGYKAQSLVGRNLFDLIYPHDLPKALGVFNEAILHPGVTEPVEFRFRHENGSWRVLESLIKNLIDNPAVGGVVVNIHDITDLKKAEEGVRKAADDLARSNKELEQFAYAASHDLQEPLRKIASYTQLLEQRYKGKLDPNADKFIGYIVDGATRMQGLIRDLLVYSRTGRGELTLEKTDMGAVVSQALSNLEVGIQESKAKITVDSLPTIMANPLLIGQLLQNLIGNAIKYRGSNPPEIHLWAEQRSSEWLFSVKDNGIGIDPQYSERIFVIFQRLHTRQEYPGTGIGLAICKKIVEHHGGRIWVESEAEKGSTFRFTLPIR